MNGSPIPYHFHLIWLGTRFPFINLMAVKTLRATNPHAPITIHYQNPPTGLAHWDSLKSLAEMRPLDVSAMLTRLEEYIPTAGKIAPVLGGISQKYPAGMSNILRYIILYLEGGIYLDFDTLTLRSYVPLLEYPAFIGEELVYRHDDDRVKKGFSLSHLPGALAFGISYAGSRTSNHVFGSSSPWSRFDNLFQNGWAVPKLNNAILGSSPGNPFYERALELIPETDPSVRYNLGPMLMNRIWEELSGGDKNKSELPGIIKRLEPKYFYSVPPSQTHRFFAVQERGLRTVLFRSTGAPVITRKLNGNLALIPSSNPLPPICLRASCKKF